MVSASAFVLLVSGAVAASPPDPAQPTFGPPVPAAPKTTNVMADPCRSQHSRDIVICAQRSKGLQIDTDVVDARRAAEQNARSVIATMPAAQANCSQSPRGCGTGLAGLDLANVALVVATTAVKAAKGEDWATVLKPGGPDEYQLYLQAKQEREAHEQQARDQAAIKTVRARP